MTRIARTRNCWLLLLIGGLWPLILRAQEVRAKIMDLPRFENYPASQWTGPAATAKLTSPSERMFRTNLRAAAKEPPNFAGHYRVAIWGCGTRCVGGAMVDLQTGKVLPLPLGGKGTGEEYWIFCTDWVGEHTLEYRRDSRLMVVRCGGMQTDAEGNSVPDLYYFVWEQNLFNEISHFRPCVWGLLGCQG